MKIFPEKKQMKMKSFTQKKWKLKIKNPEFSKTKTPKGKIIHNFLWKFQNIFLSENLKITNYMEMS